MPLTEIENTGGAGSGKGRSGAEFGMLNLGPQEDIQGCQVASCMSETSTQGRGLGWRYKSGRHQQSDGI